MDKWFLGGWLYFFAACALSFVLPEWTGKENGIIENLQLLWLVGGMAGYFLLIQMAGLSSITKWVFMASLCILSLLL